MLKVDRELQLENGIYTKIIALACKYNPKLKCNYLSYITLEDPLNTKIIPLIKENDEVFVDYSYNSSQITEMVKGISLPSTIKLPDRIKSYKRKDEKFFITSIIEETTSLDIPESKKLKVNLDETESLELPMTKSSKVVKVEEIKVEEDKIQSKTIEKPLVLHIRLNDSTYMLFKVESSTEKEYSCSKITLDELENNKDKYNVITSTLSLADFYKLKGESNITTSNNLNTKVPKFLVVDDNEQIHLLMVKYNENVFFPFVIKNETNENYEVVETDKNYIEPRPYDLVVVNLLTKEEYLNFKESYFIAKKNKTAIPIRKQPNKNLSSKIEEDIIKRTA